MSKILLAISIVLIVISAIFGGLTMGKKSSLTTELTAAQTAQKAAQGDLDKVKSVAEAAKAQAGATAEQLKAAQTDLQTARDDAASSKTKLTALTEENQKLKDAAASAPVVSNTAAPVAPVDDTKLKALEVQVAELQQVNQAMGPKVTAAEEKVKSMEGELARYKGVARAKGLEGQVLAVNGAYNFVVLSLGDRQGVVMNAQMLIYRGDRMVARVKVTSVEPSTSIGDIIPGSGSHDFRVMPGDRVVYSGA